jgi:hypothetical protein
VYGEHRDLAFFMYEKNMAMKIFQAQIIARDRNLTADVLMRDSQASAGYWEIVQAALADLVRIMLLRCYDEENYPELCRHCRGLRKGAWLCAFPNLFITIAPAEWTFPKLGSLFIVLTFFHLYITLNWKFEATISSRRIS